MFYKKTPAQVFSCEYCELVKNTYFEEHLQMAAFAGCRSTGNTNAESYATSL